MWDKCYGGAEARNHVTSSNVVGFMPIMIWFTPKRLWTRGIKYYFTWCGNGCWIQTRHQDHCNVIDVFLDHFIRGIKCLWSHYFSNFLMQWQHSSTPRSAHTPQWTPAAQLMMMQSVVVLVAYAALILPTGFDNGSGIEVGMNPH